MDMNMFSAFFFALALIWFFSGIALFAWVRWESNLRKARNLAKTTKEVAFKTKEGFKALCSLGLQTMAMLSIFWIPVAVTALTYYFGP